VSTIAMSPTLQHDVKNFIGQLLGLFIAGAFLVLILSVITGRTKIRK
jgi:putative Ca2+/H+ antiporter (TMEM165/GDT1 family)